MISRRRFVPGFSALLVAAPLLLARRAHAQKAPPTPAPPPPPLAQISADVLVLHATNTGGGIDPSLAQLPQLKQPPFSSYNTYKKLSNPRVAVAKDKITNVPLPDQGKLSLKRLDVPARYKLGVNIVKGSGESFLANLEVTGDLNEIFFVAGQVYDGGILVIGIRFVSLERGVGVGREGEANGEAGSAAGAFGFDGAAVPKDDVAGDGEA